MLNKKFSRILSLAIALVMVFSVIPMQSFAAEQLPSVGLESKDNVSLTLNKAVDATWNYEQFKKDIFEKCLRLTGDVQGLTYSDFKYEYKILNGLGVDDGILSGLYYDISTEVIPQDKGKTYRYLNKGGEFTVKVSIPESSNYQGAQAVFKIKVNTADPYAYELKVNKDFNRNFVLGFDKNGEFNYEKLRQDIYSRVIADDNDSRFVSYDNAKITYQILNGLGVDDQILSGFYYDFEQPHLDADAGGTYRYLYKGGDFNIKIAIPAAEDRRASEAVVKVHVDVDERVSSNVILKDSQMDYTKDKESVKDVIFNSIPMFNSKLPENVTKSDFKFEYKALVMLAGGTPGLTYEWAPLEGGNGPASTYYNPIGSGTFEIRVKFLGNEKYEPSSWAYAKITINPTEVNASFTTDNMYLDEKLPDNYIATDIDDSFTKYEVFSKVENDDVTIFIDTPAGLNPTLDFAANIPFNDVLIKIFGIDRILSADEIYYRRGLSRDELVTLLTNDLFISFAKNSYNIDSEALELILAEVNKLPENVNHVWFKIGKPSKPGAYNSVAVIAKENYKTAVATQTFNIRFRSKGVKLQWMQNKSELNIISANNFDFSAVVTKNGYVQDSSHVKYIYTGISLTKGIYISTKNPPRSAGIYTQTAYTGIKGRYAFPKTRTFIIGL